MEDQKTCQCPKCGEVLLSVPVASIPNEQKVSFKITHEGQYISAKTAGGALENSAALMKAVAKDLNENVDVFLIGVEQKPHELRFELAIIKLKPVDGGK